MKRVVPGILIAGFWFLLLLKGTFALFCSILVLAVLVAADEYIKMAIGTEDIGGVERMLLNILLTLPVFGVCFFPVPSALPPLLLGTFFLLIFYLLLRYKDILNGYGLLARLVFGLVYIGGLAAHFILVRNLIDGGYWLAICSAVTACSDSGAYFIGRKIGRRKLCPNVSPNKTVEGGIGGIVFGMLAGIGGVALLPVQGNWIAILFALLLLTIIGIIGDLTESIIKRGTGTKDSGKCLAGHGGILDRADSLLLAIPVLFYLLEFAVVR